MITLIATANKQDMSYIHACTPNVLDMITAELTTKYSNKPIVLCETDIATLDFGGNILAKWEHVVFHAGNNKVRFYPHHLDQVLFELARSIKKYKNIVKVYGHIHCVCLSIEDAIDLINNIKINRTITSLRDEALNDFQKALDILGVKKSANNVEEAPNYFQFPKKVYDA